MKPNVLFGVLAHLSTNCLQLQGNEQLALDTTVDKKKYYRIDLPVTGGFIGHFTLKHAHISVYELIEPANPTLGPSHFTAFFQNEQGQKFRMHLYLNRADTLAFDPTWEMLNNTTNTYHPTVKPKSLDIMINEVWQMGLPCLQILRKQQKQIQATLVNDYNQAESEVSQGFGKSGKSVTTYVQKVEQLVSILKKLSSVSENSRWFSLIPYCEQLKKFAMQENSSSAADVSVAAIPPKPVALSESLSAAAAAALAATTDVAHSSSEISSSHSSSCLETESQKISGHESSITAQKASGNTLFASSRPSLERIKITKAQKDIEKLQFLLANIKSQSNDSNKTVMIIELRQKLRHFESTTLDQTRCFRDIESQMNKESKALLERAILTKQFDRARGLSAFYDQINPDIFHLALMNRNPEVLEFLVKTIGFSINSLPVTIKGKNYDNAVYYCFDQEVVDDKLIRCWSVLIQNQACLMLPVGPAKLPLAHVILSATTHPLKAVLENNKKLTLGNKNFWGNLISALSHCLKSSELTVTDKENISKWISSYNSLKSGTQFQQSIFNHSNIELSNEVTEIARGFLSNEMRQALQTDKDVIDKAKTNELTAREMMETFTVYLRIIGKHCAVQNYLYMANKKYRDQLLKCDLRLSEIVYSDVKEGILSTLGNSTELMSACIESMNVTIELSKIPFNQKNKRKPLINKQKELQDKIKTLEEKMPLNSLESYNQMQDAVNTLTQASKSMNELQVVMQKMGEILTQATLSSSSSDGDVSLTDAVPPPECRMQ